MALTKYEEAVVRLKLEIKELTAKRETIIEDTAAIHDAWIKSIEYRDKQSKEKARNVEDAKSTLNLAIKEFNIEKTSIYDDVDKLKADYKLELSKLAQDKIYIDKYHEKLKLEKESVEGLKILAEQQQSNNEIIKADIEKNRLRVAKESKIVTDRIAELDKKIHNDIQTSTNLKNLVNEIKKAESDLDKKSKLIVEKTNAQEIGLAKLEKERELLLNDKFKLNKESLFNKSVKSKLDKKDAELKETENNLIVWNQKLIKRDQLRQNAK